MGLLIKKAKTVAVSPSSDQHDLTVDIDGLELDEVLNQIDIIEAINYYGKSELLDIVGEEAIRFYLANMERNSIT